MLHNLDLARSVGRFEEFIAELIGGNTVRSICVVVAESPTRSFCLVVDIVAARGAKESCGSSSKTAESCPSVPPLKWPDGVSKSGYSSR